MIRSFIAVAASRTTYGLDDPSRSWYTVIVVGPRGGTYEVDLVYRPSLRRPVPYATRRLGRVTMSLGPSRYDHRHALEQAAIEAVRP